MARERLPSRRVKRVRILVGAYNAAATSARVLDRVPHDFVPHNAKILVNDDFSADSTYLVGLGYQQLVPSRRVRDQTPDKSRGADRSTQPRRPRQQRAGRRVGETGTPRGRSMADALRIQVPHLALAENV
jgi:hypothetical protein